MDSSGVNRPPFDHDLGPHTSGSHRSNIQVESASTSHQRQHEQHHLDGENEQDQGENHHENPKAPLPTSPLVPKLPTYIDSSLLRYYSLSNTEQETAVRMLWQLCESHPQITFAPTLFPLIAFFLHKHDQDYTYKTICQLLQTNHQAARERQFKRILMPTTRLEHVRDVIVLIKLCTKFGILAPFWMRDLVREERRFLANLERDSSSRLTNSPGSSSLGSGSRGNTRRFRSLNLYSSNSNRNNNGTSLSNGNTPSHNHNCNSNSNHNNNNTTHIHNNCNHINQSCIGTISSDNYHMRHNYLTFDTPFFDWYKWIFVALPLAYCARIIDCWLVDGQKFLYRIALAMLSRFRQQCSHPIAFSSNGMFEFCSKLESTLEQKGGVEQLIKEAKSLKRISSVKIAKVSRKAESKANLILQSIMRKDNHQRLCNQGQSAQTIEQPREDMLNRFIICSRIAPRSFKSSIVDDYELFDDLWQYIPERAAVKSVNVVFNSNDDGTSLQTFFSRVDPFEESIIIIRTIKNEVFGSYCSSSWSNRKNQTQSASKKSYYFGNGETFLFTLRPKFSVYLWVGKTESDINYQHYQNPSTNQTPQLKFNNNGNLINNLDADDEALKPGRTKHRDSVTDSISTQLFMSATSQELIIGSGNGSFGLWLDADLTRGKTDHCRTFNNSPLCADKDFTCRDVEVLAFD